jgi:predicted ATPase/class 3 adenylate cyclase/DNA-binding CsgD family transcriptional regulator
MIDGVELPDGMVSLLLTDVEASSAAWERDPLAMAEAVPRSLALVEHVVAEHGGFVPVERGEGDSRLAAFELASDALAAAIAIQRQVGDNGEDGVGLKLRIALHASAGLLRDEGTYGGLAVHRAARLRALAQGGQIVVSRAVHDLVIDGLPIGVELVDVGLHRLRGLARPEQVFLVRCGNLGEVEEGLASVASIPHNLPARLSSFIGRDAELLELGTVLAANRLVTLTGPGGCGKTRLALEAAADAAPANADGVWLVELSAVQDGRLVASAILDALGLGEAPGQEIVDRLVAYFGERQVLLVLDTCEHLVEDVAALTHRLLEHCAGLRVLATSREPLGVTGEVSWRVPPLGVDDGVCDAVSLFIERARGARPTFTLLAKQRQTAVEICRRLDGLPLAIELAAARVRTLPLERIASGLDDRFRLLAGGARTALPRHRTLQASVEWSHALLGDDERAVLRRLSVFPDAFDLDTAEDVVAGDGVDRIITFDVVSRLVDKSLVQIEDDVGSMRYAMLDTIRQFAADRLVESGEVQVVRDRHLAQVRSMAESAEAGIERGDRSVLRHLIERRDDIRLALEWACSHRQHTEAALSIVGALAQWWSSRGSASEGRAWCDRALECADDAGDTALVLKVRWGRAHTNWSVGNPIASVEEAAEVAALAAKTGDVKLQARCVNLTSNIANLVEPREGEAISMRAAELAAQSGDAWTIADVGRGLILCALWRGDWQEAERRIAHVETLAGRTDVDPCFLRSTRAYAALMRGDFEAAETAGRSAQELAVDETTGFSLATIFRVLALVELGRTEAAEAALHEGEIHARSAPGPLGAEQLAFARGTVLLWKGDHLAAVEVLEPLHETLAAYGLAVLAEYVTLHLAAAHRHLGQIDVAITRAEEAAALSRRTGARRLEAAALLVQAQLASLNDDKRADVLAHEALAAAHECGSEQWTTMALEHLSCLALRAESHAEGVRLVAAARAARGRLHLARGPLDVDLEEPLATTRAAMHDDEFSTVWAEGLAMPLVDAVAYCRRARGERARPSTGWDSLTPTERQVVELVAFGLTNPQIGERLFVTRGTVKTHLAHIFTKLGLANRAELAAEVVRHST